MGGDIGIGVSRSKLQGIPDWQRWGLAAITGGSSLWVTGAARKKKPHSEETRKRRKAQKAAFRPYDQPGLTAQNIANWREQWQPRRTSGSIGLRVPE